MKSQEALILRAIFSAVCAIGERLFSERLEVAVQDGSNRFWLHRDSVRWVTLPVEQGQHDQFEAPQTMPVALQREPSTAR